MKQESNKQKIQDKELLITHLFEATVDVVFEAWTDPEKLKHWYAPDGCMSTETESPCLPSILGSYNKEEVLI